MYNEDLDIQLLYRILESYECLNIKYKLSHCVAKQHTIWIFLTNFDIDCSIVPFSSTGIQK